MASSKISQKRGYRKSCLRCRKIRRRCDPSEFNPRICVNCHEVKVDCSLSATRATPSTDAKRKVEVDEIGDTPEREAIRTTRAASSVTAPFNPDDSPIAPARKKSRRDKRVQPASIHPAENISSDACGICLKESRSSGEKMGDATMLKCDIEGCETWYHLSCVQFKKDTKPAEQIFHALATGTEKTIFFCVKCFRPEREDLVAVIAQATSDYRHTMGLVKQHLRFVKEGWSETLLPSPLRRDPQTQSTHNLEHSSESLEMDEPRPTYFERASQEKYEGFETEKINSLLKEIRDAVYYHDREICYAKDLFHHGSEISMSHPLRVWDQIDHGQHIVSGKQWFEVNGESNNLSESHAPITAALRKILGTHDDDPLYISPDLMDLSFSEVHTALINWFVFDILNNELNIYLFPNMKPLRAMMAAVANFGDQRWNGSGRQVLREVQLRAWHKLQFREEVVENAGWQGELIHRLDQFLKPLTKKIGNIHPESRTRASIVKHTIELWTYLEAARGKMEIIQPTIGGSFDERFYKNVAEELHSGGRENREVKWVIRRGFRFEEDCLDGSGRPLMKKALVVVR